MSGLLYSTDHAWARPEGARVRVGLSRFAEQELGEIAFVDLPEPGRAVRAGEAVCVVDSLKSTSEIVAPLSGRIVEVNEALRDEEHVADVNSDPLGKGWLFVMEMSAPSEMQALMSEERYASYVAACGDQDSPSR